MKSLEFLLIGHHNGIAQSRQQSHRWRPIECLSQVFICWRLKQQLERRTLTAFGMRSSDWHIDSNQAIALWWAWALIKIRWLNNTISVTYQLVSNDSFERFGWRLSIVCFDSTVWVVVITFNSAWHQNYNKRETDKEKKINHCDTWRWEGTKRHKGYLQRKCFIG